MAARSPIFAVLSLAGGIAIPLTAGAQKSAPAPAVVTNRSLSVQSDQASFVHHHHYNSDAERARDDLIITQVKSALIKDGVARDYPVEVDCDHGTVLLNGVVRSPAEIARAGEIARSVPGVVAINNKLRHHGE